MVVRCFLYYNVGSKSGPGASRKPARSNISVNDRVSVYLELAEAHRILGNQVNYLNYIQYGHYVNLPGMHESVVFNLLE